MMTTLTKQEVKLNYCLSMLQFELIRKKKYIILSPDLDGFVSYLIFKKYFNENAILIGTYDCETLWLNKTKEELENIKDDVLLLDGNIELFDSVDHHLLNTNLLVKDTRTINPNLIVGNQDLLYSKCPFNTVLLLSTYSKEFYLDIKKAITSDDLSFIGTLVYPDNFINYMTVYSSNFLSWCKTYCLDDLHQYVSSRKTDLHDFCSRIEKNLVFFNLIKPTGKPNSFSQSRANIIVNTEQSFYKSESEAILKIFEVLGKLCPMLKLENESIDELVYKTKFSRSLLMDTEIIDKELDVVSHAILNGRGKINVTYEEKYGSC